MWKFISLPFFLLAGCFVSASEARSQAFECPTPQQLTSPDVLRETPARTAELATLLASGDVGNRIPVVVNDLRARYPGVQNAEIVNYLMTAYCPTVKQLTGLGDAEKQARMDSFMSRVSQVVY